MCILYISNTCALYKYTGNRSALKIQRIWRGHQGRKRAMRSRIRAILSRHALSITRPIYAACTLQRRYRGAAARLRIHAKVKYKKAVVIQCFWRQMEATKERDRLEKRQAAIATMVSFVSCRCLVRRLKIRSALRRKHCNLFKIQRLARRFLYRLRRRGELARQRVEKEATKCLEVRLVSLLAEFQLQLLLESMERSIGGQAYLGSGNKECVHTGVLQAIFIAALGSKARTDRDALNTNRLEMKRLTQLLRKVNGLLEVKAFGNKKKKLGRLRGPAEPYALATAYDLKILPLPEGAHPVTSIETDLLFSRIKASSAVGKGGLEFKEFINFMEELSQLHFDQADSCSGKQGGGGSCDRCSLDSVMHSSHKALALAVNLLLSIHAELWFSPIAKYITLESSARLGGYAIRIQNMTRRKFSKVFREKLREKRRREAIAGAYLRHIIMCQSILRRFIHRRRAGLLLLTLLSLKLLLFYFMFFSSHRTAQAVGVRSLRRESALFLQRRYAGEPGIQA